MANIGLAYPNTANGRSSNLVQCYDVANRGLTQLFEYFVVILPDKASQSHGEHGVGSRGTHTDVIIDCIVCEVRSLTMATVKIGFLFDHR